MSERGGEKEGKSENPITAVERAGGEKGGKSERGGEKGGRLCVMREALFLMVPAPLGGARDHQEQCGAEKGKVVFQGGRQGLVREGRERREGSSRAGGKAW